MPVYAFQNAQMVMNPIFIKRIESPDKCHLREKKNNGRYPIANGST